MSKLDSSHFLQIYGYGHDGFVTKSSDEKIGGFSYILQEYFPGVELFTLVHELKAMGEDMGRHLLGHLVSALEVLQSNRVVHRDIKLENVMVNDNLDVKLIDFGFGEEAISGSVKSFKGTKTYMAPEIRELVQPYNGLAADIFATAVVVFSVTRGIFPFNKACSSDKFWQLLVTDPEKYWHQLNCGDSSENFRDLMMKMLHPNFTKRATLA